MELVHVYVTILFLVLESAHLWSTCVRCWRVAIIIFVVPCLIILFLILVIWDHLEVKLSSGSGNCCQRDHVFFHWRSCDLHAHSSRFGWAINNLFLAIDLHVAILRQELCLIVLRQCVLILLLFGLLLFFGLKSGFLCSVLVSNNP